MPTELLADCLFFKGDVPCLPHKQNKVTCYTEVGKKCDYYLQVQQHILIIKLGAIGDVIRTTPLYGKLREEYPNSRIYWLSYSIDILPDTVDYTLDAKDPLVYQYLLAMKFDIAINLDKDKEVCGFFSRLTSNLKYGFILNNNIVSYCNPFSKAKYLTGINDTLSQQNTKSYLEELFEIVGYTYDGRSYILNSYKERGYSWKSFNKKGWLIGLNTGCGSKWPSRVWPLMHWATLIELLFLAGYEVVLLGGEDEDAKNKYLASTTHALYLGYFKLPQFINLVHQCDLVVTVVTMSLHVALGLKKRVVVLNNIFNKNEFELFGLGVILEPVGGCDCYYAKSCTRPQGSCMQNISPKTVMEAIKQILPI